MLFLPRKIATEFGKKIIKGYQTKALRLIRGACLFYKLDKKQA